MYLGFLVVTNLLLFKKNKLAIMKLLAQSFTLFTSCILLLTLFSCHKKAKDVDLELYNLTKETSGFTWYKNSDLLLESAKDSHSDPKLRTRFNAIAAVNLTADGAILNGQTFSTGALIVKEMYNKREKLKSYAIMYKDATNKNADSDGWVWASLNEKGKVLVSSDLKGKECASCHSQSQNIDRTLMNKFH